MRPGIGTAKCLGDASKLLNVAAYCVTGACSLHNQETSRLTNVEFPDLNLMQTRNVPGGEAAGEDQRGKNVLARP